MLLSLILYETPCTILSLANVAYDRKYIVITVSILAHVTSAGMLFYVTLSYSVAAVVVVLHLNNTFLSNQRLNAEEPILNILWLTVNQEIMRT